MWMMNMMNDILIRTRNVYTRKDWQETSTLAVFHGYMPGIFQGFSVASAASSCSICLLAWKGLVYLILFLHVHRRITVLFEDGLIPIKLPYFEGRYDKVSSRDEVWIRSNGSQASNILGFLLKHGRGWKSAAILAIYVLPWAYVNLLVFAEKIVSPSRARRRCVSTGRCVFHGKKHWCGVIRVGKTLYIESLSTETELRFNIF